MPNIRKDIKELEERLSNAMACKAFALVTRLDEQLAKKKAKLDDIRDKGDHAAERRRQRERAMRNWRPPIAPWVETYSTTTKLNHRKLSGVR